MAARVTARGFTEKGEKKMSGERLIVCETDLRKQMKMFLGNTTQTQLGSHMRR